MAGTVTVACKLPNGVILRGFNFEMRAEQVMGGGTRDVKVAVDGGQRVVINGMATAPNSQRLDMAGAQVSIVSGFALTHGVDADLWENWLSMNKDSDMVRNGLIFAQGKPLDARSQAREHREQKSGMEPMARLDPRPDGSVERDPRMPVPRQRFGQDAGKPAFSTAT